MGFFVLIEEKVDIRIRINNWEKYNGRLDVKRASWFRFQNNFFDDNKINNLEIEEKFIFIWLLCEASKCDNDMFFVDDSLLRSIQRIHQRSSQRDIQRIINKLKKLQLVTVLTIRGRYADVEQTIATLQDSTLQDKTIHSSCDSKESHVSEFSLDDIYNAYPKRLGASGKGKGIAKLKRLITSQADYDLAMRAVTNYTALQKKNGKIGTEYIKQFATFWDSMGDWVEWANMQTEVESKEDWKAKMIARLK